METVHVNTTDESNTVIFTKTKNRSSASNIILVLVIPWQYNNKSTLILVMPW